MIRIDGRSPLQLRPLSIEPHIYPNAAGSVLISLGNTRILCAASLTNGVPSFLRGKNTGWLTAEYAMLPAATHERTGRDNVACKKNGRSVEISRLIGRSFRTVTNMQAISDKTLILDCDVLQADGSTRVASIIGAQVALALAQKKLLNEGIIASSIFHNPIAAVSVGMLNGEPLVDLCYQEDTQIDVDFNIVMTRSGDIIEVQGSAEKRPIAWAQFQELTEIGRDTITQLFDQLNPYLSL